MTGRLESAGRSRPPTLLWTQSDLRRGGRRQAALNPGLYRTVLRRSISQRLSRIPPGWASGSPSSVAPPVAMARGSEFQAGRAELRCSWCGPYWSGRIALHWSRSQNCNMKLLAVAYVQLTELAPPLPSRRGRIGVRGVGHVRGLPLDLGLTSGAFSVRLQICYTMDVRVAEERL
jgi:hypothetical protein